MHEDHATIVAVRKGDWSAFESLVANYSSELVRLALAITQSMADAEDAAQDVFSWVWANREKWNPAVGVRPYLLRAVANRARDIKEKRDNRIRLEKLHLQSPDVVELTDAIVGDAELWGAINKLQDRWREAIVLRYIENLPFAQIGVVMEISEDAAKKLVKRALGALREGLE